MAHDPNPGALGASNEYQALVAAVGRAGPIFEDCYSYSVFKVCVKVTLDKACATLYIAGAKVVEASVGWSMSGRTLKAELEFSTINVGLYKLEKPVLQFEHDVRSNDGECRLTTKLYKLGDIPPDFKLKKEWTSDVIFNW